jgi:tetratricopeptide (TPR) repeat protein
MLRYVLGALALITSLQVAAPQDDVNSALARAEQLYYEARFREAVDLLLPIDAALGTQPEGLQDKIKVKLQLALAHIGLSETSAAGDRFGEIVDLDPSYSLDPRRYSDKVVSLFDEVKEEHNRGRCRTICVEGDRLLDTADAQSLLERVRSSAADCVCLEATALDAAEHFFQQGLEAYKQESFTTALENFRLALEFQAEHPLAKSYVQLTLDKLRLAADRLFLEWRQNFEANQFALAAAAFHQLQSANTDGAATSSLNQAVTLYRQSASRIVGEWKQACTNGDAIAMDAARNRTTEMLPDSTLAGDLMAQMQTCANPKCLQMTNRLAMARLKARVEPEVPPAALTRSTSVQVQARIDEEGNVFVRGVRGGSAAVQNAVKSAVERWKFAPAIVDKQIRCVDTEIPIQINR